MEQPSGPPQKESAKLERKTEVFTGKVVLVDGAYRLSLLKDPDTLLRLTRARAKRRTESRANHHPEHQRRCQHAYHARLLPVEAHNLAPPKSEGGQPNPR